MLDDYKRGKGRRVDKLIKSIEEVTELNLIVPFLNNSFQLIANLLYIFLSPRDACTRILSLPVLLEDIICVEIIKLA